MKYFIIHAHHEPKSFNGAMLRCAVDTLTGDGHEVRVSDLYAMGFGAVSDRRNFTTVADASYLKQQVEETHASQVGGFAPEITAEIEKLEWCDVLIFQFPLWWFGLPGILKSWVDRVFVMGRVYGGGRWYDTGAFVGKRAMAALTTGGPEAMYQGGGINPLIDHVMGPIEHGMFWFTGFSVLPRFIAWSVARVEQSERTQILERYAAHLRATYHNPGLAPPKAAG